MARFVDSIVRHRIGELRHRITLSSAGTTTADGDGGYTQSTTSLGSAWASIVPATAQALERLSAGTVRSTATHVIAMRYRSDVTTQTVITFGSRTFYVLGVSDPDERQIETVVIAAEVVS